MCTQPLVSGAEKEEAVVIPIDVLPLKELGTFRRPYVPGEADLPGETLVFAVARKKNDEIRKCRAADNTVPAQRFKGPASGRARPVPCLRFGSEDNATCRHCP